MVGKFFSTTGVCLARTGDAIELPRPFNHHPGSEPIEKVVPRTPCSQNIQQLIGFFNPNPSHYTNPALNQADVGLKTTGTLAVLVTQQAGRWPDNGNFGSRAVSARIVMKIFLG